MILAIDKTSNTQQRQGACKRSKPAMFSNLPSLKADTVSFSGKNLNKVLCPDIWQGKSLKPEISERLEKIADLFQKSLAMDFKRNDLVIVGSMANYNFAKHSDIDLHLVTDFNLYNADEKLLADYFKTKRDTFNYMNCFRLNGHPVEVSVENNGKNIFSKGRYSIQSKKWITEPIFTDKTQIPEITKLPEYAALKAELDTCLKNKDFTQVKQLFGKIVALRKMGLVEGGELSIGNLIFKQLRNEGYIKKLVDLGHDALNNLINI